MDTRDQNAWFYVMEDRFTDIDAKRFVTESADGTALHSKRDRLKQLRTFCHVARLGGMSRAAEYLMSSQPAVSLQVSALEEDLGVSLFERSGRGMKLTSIGESVYRFAMPLVQGLDRLPDTFAEQHHGTMDDVLRIGAGQTSAAYLLPRYLEQFRKLYPGVRIEVKTASGRERLRWLREYELDLIVVAMDVPPADLEFHLVRVSDPMLIAPLNHPLAERGSVSIEEASVYPFVASAPTHYVRQTVEAMLRQRGVTVDVVIEVDGWAVITNYVEVGIGISIVPDICLGRNARVWKTSMGSVIPPRKYGAMARRDGLLSTTAKRFLRLMVAEASQTPWERRA